MIRSFWSLGIKMGLNKSQHHQFAQPDLSKKGREDQLAASHALEPNLDPSIRQLCHNLAVPVTAMVYSLAQEIFWSTGVSPGGFCASEDLLDGKSAARLLLLETDLFQFECA
jgi:hypothetical protein